MLRENIVSTSQTLLEDVALCDLILSTEGPVFLRDEDSALATALTDLALSSLIALTVTIAVIIIAVRNADTAKASRSVETLLVFIRADCRVLITFIDVNTGGILSQLVSRQTAIRVLSKVRAGGRDTFLTLNRSTSLPSLKETG